MNRRIEAPNETLPRAPLPAHIFNEPVTHACVCHCSFLARAQSNRWFALNGISLHSQQSEKEIKNLQEKREPLQAQPSTLEAYFTRSASDFITRETRLGSD